MTGNLATRLELDVVALIVELLLPPDSDERSARGRLVEPQLKSNYYDQVLGIRKAAGEVGQGLCNIVKRYG